MYFLQWEADSNDISKVFTRHKAVLRTLHVLSHLIITYNPLRLVEVKVLRGSVINPGNTESKLPDQNLNPGNAPKTVVSYKEAPFK